MSSIAVLRDLWRHRAIVAIGLALAVLLGILIAYKVTLGVPPDVESRQYEVGLATAEMLVDSPSSQLADIGGAQVLTDVGGLAGRARLLANLMTVSPLKDEIARRAGLEAGRLIAIPPASEFQAPKPNALDPDTSDRQAIRLTIGFNDVLPIISATTQAPTPQLAARVSTAAVEELQAYLKTIAASDRVPDARQLVISPLGPARAGIVARGPRRLYGVLAAMALFGLWCAAVIGVTRLARLWREAALAEALSDGETELDDVEAPVPQPASRSAAMPPIERLSAATPAHRVAGPIAEPLDVRERPHTSRGNAA